MRTVTATAAAVTAALATGVASVAAGRLASDAALKAPPGRPLPTEPRLTVHGTAAGQITLTRHLAALRPGRYGLAGDGSHAVLGPVLDTAEHGADTVVRRLERVTHGTLATGDRAWFTPTCTSGTRARPSTSSTPTSRSRGNSARSRPGSCPGPGRPGSSPCTAWPPPANTR